MPKSPEYLSSAAREQAARVVPPTFLFTDIEGSAEKWEREPESMARAVIAHDALLRGAIEEHRGRVIKSTGDGVYAIFADAIDGVAAVVAIYLALSDATATAGVALHVRCGLHSGEAQRQGDDFIGPTINRAARVMSLAYGGQALLSQAVADQVIGRVPAAFELRDLGDVRLKGLAGTEHVFQVLHPRLRNAFPALQSLAATPNNLPEPLTSFIGRDREIAEAQALLSRTRLLTLCGIGGLGKTRLALQVARHLMDGYRDGAWFLDLAPIREEALVASEAAKVLDVREEPGQPIVNTLCTHVRSRSLLLILDNCEHLLEASAALAMAILQAAPKVRLIATSREPLHVLGEQTYPLAPLPMPSPNDGLDVLMKSSAVRLFVERAQQHKPNFVLDERASHAIGELVARLDGIPLALELAAARVRSLSLADINARLNDRYKLLIGGSHGQLERQRTLRALVDWSFDLLRPDEQILFERLFSFAGTFDLAAAEAICSYEPLALQNIIDLVRSLVDKSLLVCEEGTEGSRYRMLETIREYARMKLVERGEVDQALSRHCDYYSTLAKDGRTGLQGAEQAVWITRLEMETDNLRAAMAHSMSDSGHPALGLRIEVNLQGFRTMRGYATEGRNNLRSIMAHPRIAGSDRARGHALYTAAALASSQGDDLDAERMLETCLALRRGLGNDLDTAAALSTLSAVRLRRGDAAAARAAEEEALAIFIKIEEREGQAIALQHLGENCAYIGAYDEACNFFDRSLAIARALVLYELESDSERMLGLVALERKDVVEARMHLCRALDISMRSENKSGTALALSGLARLDLAAGDQSGALRHAREALSAFDAFGMSAEIIASLEDHAELICALGQPLDAARLLGAAMSARARLTVIRTPHRQAEHLRIVEAVRAKLDAAAFDAAWTDGRAMTLREAVVLAIALDEQSGKIVARFAGSGSEAAI